MVSRSMRGRAACLAFLASLAMLSLSCENPLADWAAALQTQTVSPKMVVSYSLSEVSAGGGVSVGTIGLYETVALRLTVRNAGVSRLVIPSGAITFTLGDGTEAGVFGGAEWPSGVEPGASAAITVSIEGLSSGRKECELAIATNDVFTPVFRLSIDVDVSNYARASTPSSLRAEEGNHSVRLDWDEVAGAEGYNLYWATSESAIPDGATKVFVSADSYTHEGLENETTLYYAVSTLGLGGESGLSDAVSAMPHRYMVYVNNGGIGGSDCSTSGYSMDRSTGSLAASAGSPFDVGSFPYSIAFDPLARFAYISSFNTRQISSYAVGQDSGSLNAIVGSLVSAGSGVSKLTAAPSGKFLYAVNSTNSFNGGGSSISIYSIDQSTGAIAAVSGSPYAVGADLNAAYQPQDLVINKTGSFAYAPIPGTGDGQEVAVFSINGATGALTKVGAIDDSGDAQDYGVHSLALHPNGKFLYRAFWNNGNNIFLQGFTLNTVTGLLQSGQATRRYDLATSSNHVQAVEVDPTGRFLYALLYSQGKIAVYSIDQSTGDLTAAPGSPFAAWDGSSAYSLRGIDFDPSGGFAYIVASQSAYPYAGTLRSFSIDQDDGHLTLIGEPIEPGSNSCDIAVVSLP